MSEARFNVVFSGQLVAGADPSKVRANLANAFRMDIGKVESLFSGKRVVVKKDADQATAMKFRAVMKQAGAHAELERLGEDAANRGSLETVGTIRMGGTGFSGEFEVAPTGADLAIERNLPPPVVPDVSHLNLAPAGSDMGEKKEQKTPLSPDISHLKIEPL